MISSSQLQTVVASKLVRVTGSIAGTCKEEGGSQGGGSPSLEVVSSLGGGLAGPEGQRLLVWFRCQGWSWTLCTSMVHSLVVFVGWSFDMVKGFTRIVVQRRNNGGGGHVHRAQFQ